MKINRCTYCGGNNPPEAHFCIECGTDLVSTNTGPTIQLTTILCPSCGTDNPEAACFCVRCGQRLIVDHAFRQRPTRSTFAQPKISPRIDTNPILIPTPPVRHQSTSFNKNIGPLVLLGGIFILLTTHHLWPWILVIIGLSSFFGSYTQGKQSLLSVVWLIGLAFLFATNLFWPGILFLLLLTTLIHKHN